MTADIKIDYIEFTAPDLEGENAFFAEAFGWASKSYGDDYLGLENAGLDGGLERAPRRPPLVVLYHDNLDVALAQVTRAGGKITRPIFDFPGGRRFEFATPGGTALAVWTKGED